MGQTAYVSEALAFSAPESIDREKGIVRGVRVLNTTSRNRRTYPEAVLRAAVDKYAARCNLGHHRHPVTGVPVEAPPEKRFGRHAAPRIVSGGVSTDFHFNPEHPYAKPFLWAAENDPGSVCFSPLHNCEWSVEAGGQRTARAVLEVASVDLVTDGGTTFGVFESYSAEAAMAADPKAIAGDLETPGAWLAFLTDLFAEMKGLDQSTKDTIRAMVNAALDGAGPDPAVDPAAVPAVMESLRRFGKAGRWAAEQLDRLLTAERLAQRRKWADDLIAAEQVPAAVVTPLFVETVAESFGNEARAKELIADRKRLAPAGGGTGGTGGGSGQPQGSPAGGGKKSVKELVAEYTAG